MVTTPLTHYLLNQNELRGNYDCKLIFSDKPQSMQYARYIEKDTQNDID